MTAASRWSTLAAALLPAAVLLPAAAQDAPRLVATVEPAEATVGDRVAVELTLVTPPGALTAEPRFPVWDASEPATWGGAEILEAGPPERSSGGPREGGGETWRQRLTVTAFRPGRIALPPRPVALPGPGGTLELSTPADLSFEVVSVLPEGADPATAAPAPPAPPRPLPLGETFGKVLTLGLAAIAALGAVLLRRRAADPERRVAPPPPHRELEERLATIGGAPEAAHVALSGALRRYLGRRLDFPAAESTTSEVREELRRRRLPGLVAEAAGEVLAGCDRVKFAAVPATEEELGERVRTTRTLCRALEEHLAPSPEPGPGPGPGGSADREAA